MSANALHVAGDADENLCAARHLVAQSSVLARIGVSQALIHEALPDLSADTMENRRLERVREWVVFIDIDGKNLISNGDADVQQALIEQIHHRLRGRLPITRIADDSVTLSYYASGDTDVSRRAAAAFARGIANLTRMYMSDVSFEIAPVDQAQPVDLAERHLCVAPSDPAR